jgi:hypothetical protein
MTFKPPYPQDMQDALDQFCRESAQIIQLRVKTLQNPPPIIYHYTDDVGLKGILESGQIWLTDIFNLNDPSEVRHGFSHAVNILKSKVANDPPDGKRFAEGLEAFFRQGKIEEVGHHFVCSFSSCGDDLGQWRAYGDNGRGYALGFDAKVLQDGFTNGGGPSNTEAFLITYNDSDLDNMLGQIIERMLALISLPRGRNLAGAACKDYMIELYTQLSVYALRTALFFKHEAYDNEKEYRFLQFYTDFPPPDMKLRARPYSLTRYREFDWRAVAAGALKRIVVGPAANHEKAVQFTRDCLRFFHTETVPITRSSIPYRVG